MILSDDIIEQAQDFVYKKTSIELFKAWSLFFEKYNNVANNRWSVTTKKYKFLILNMEFPKFISTLSPFVVLILGAGFVNKGVFTIGTLIMYFTIRTNDLHSYNFNSKFKG